MPPNDKKKISDAEIYELLHTALLSIMDKKGETAHGSRTLQTSVAFLQAAQIGLLGRSEKAASETEEQTGYYVEPEFPVEWPDWRPTDK